MCKNLATLPAGISRQKICFVSTQGTAAAGFTNNQLTFMLPVTLTDVIAVCWKNNTLFYNVSSQPCTIYVDKFDNSSYTTSGGNYWAYINQSTNFETPYFPASTQEPRSYQMLTFTVSDMAGVPIAVLPEWTIEIEFLVQLVKRGENGACPTCKEKTCGSAPGKRSGGCPYANK